MTEEKGWIICRYIHSVWSWEERGSETGIVSSIGTRHLLRPLPRVWSWWTGIDLDFELIDAVRMIHVGIHRSSVDDRTMIARSRFERDVS